MNKLQNNVINKNILYNDVSSSDIQKSLLIEVPDNQITLPTATTYFIELDQLERTFVRINENEVKYLNVNNVNVRNENSEDINVVTCEEEKLNETIEPPPLGSSENPIQILHDGGKILPTQNLSKAQLELITNALQLENETISERKKEVPANNFIYKVVYPEELDLKRTLNEHSKRGRPKKRPTAIKETVPAPEKTPIKNVRTRSGRITRPPRHIEKDFKKIDITEHDENEMEVVTIDFTPIPSQNQSERAPQLAEPLQMHQKKRNISSQYRCPVCKKAYMGRSRMINHLQKNPDHGPLPEHCKDNNFETWNYLVEITQKCPVGSRGKKFCEEITNLLHNLKILTKMLFKPATEVLKNNVQVDKVLGNALNLTPGNYRFNENELYKDVTVFTLLEDNRFFEDNLLAENDLKQKSNDPPLNSQKEPSQTNLGNEKLPDKDSESVLNFTKNNERAVKKNNEESNQQHTESIVYNNSYISESIHLELSNLSNDKIDSGEPPHKIYSTHNGENTSEKKITDQTLIRSVLLSDNSLLSSLPNLRNSVDELMLPVDAGPVVSNLLDNSVSSDEVMNVDQFVNERFKKITEPDMELHNSINLDLHSLDIFNFHSS